MIVVIAATGDRGACVLGDVLDAGADVRIIARYLAQVSSDIWDRVEIVDGSHADPEVIERALDGASAVFWLPPGDPTEPDAHAVYVGFSTAFAEVLTGSSVKHVVGVSALGRGWPKPAGLVSASLAMDDLTGATGVSYRALCCALLMDNVFRQVEPIRAEGTFYAPTPGDLALPHLAKKRICERSHSEKMGREGPSGRAPKVQKNILDSKPKRLSEIGRHRSFAKVSLFAAGFPLPDIHRKCGICQPWPSRERIST